MDDEQLKIIEDALNEWACRTDGYDANEGRLLMHSCCGLPYSQAHDAGCPALCGLEAVKALREQAEQEGFSPCDMATAAAQGFRDGQAAAMAEQAQPVAWLVCSVNGNGSLSLEHAAAWEDAAHDHISDAITEYGIEDAATWVVRQAYTSPPPRQPLADVVKAAQRILEFTEMAHRPPVRDKLEVGRMVGVQLHALADLHNALVAYGIKE